MRFLPHVPRSRFFFLPAQSCTENHSGTLRPIPFCATVRRQDICWRSWGSTSPLLKSCVEASVGQSGLGSGHGDEFGTLGSPVSESRASSAGTQSSATAPQRARSLTDTVYPITLQRQYDASRYRLGSPERSRVDSPAQHNGNGSGEVGEWLKPTVC